ncbi:LuxR C-terminal-related transcriptional regulator [Amycolatopsis regifaucium]|uniref:DNA-binding response regulator n=1 Tax=Amycolatopsis regifaucium TaxID=546365 RepID=A0A154MG94_9PSEU|nr:response regulator transcription factor [Amycolatopsis regifaucium]KZB83455.1 helix-turn-helix transcriptional regulator [Amycolatopsis regifaucium]OKA08917.1 DNA-binding response regulator [Amycolatopsis regifaucium]
MTTILICDSRGRVRNAVGQAMATVPGVEHIDCVAGPEELLTRYSHRPADLVLVGLDRFRPSGVEAIRRLVHAYRRANILVFGAANDPLVIASAITGGARGYVRWDTSWPEVVSALADTLGNVSVPVPRQPSSLGVQLTSRELQVLTGMSQGKSNSAIGRELHLAEDTVKTHARRMFKKLGVRDRAQAVAHGFRRGVLV